MSGSNFPSSKNEKKTLLKSFLYFREMELSNHKLKKTLFQKKLAKSIFQKKLAWPANQ